MKVYSALVALLILITSVPSTDAAALQNMAMATGSCERLVVDGHDFTKDCGGGKIMQSAYRDGRTGWYLTIGNDGAVVTLSGMSGAKPDPDSQTQTVDEIILNLGIGGVKPTTEKVSGTCLYGNPYKGPVSITCTAKNAEGAITAMEFRTDGTPPQLMNGN
jgi:hypothetical protein